MSSIYSIYSAYCVVTKQRYIGFDSRWPKRQQTHKRESQKNNNIKFYNAIKKYGWDNFVWEVIYQSLDGEYCLNVMEEFFINEFDSIKNGYNIASGGRRGPILFGEANGMFGKKHTDEIKQQNSLLDKKTFKGKSYEQLYGKEKSDQLKQIRSNQSKNKNNSYKNNPRFDNSEYTFYNLQTGEIVKCNRWIFYHNYKINKSGVSEIINKGITYKAWCIIHT